MACDNPTSMRFRVFEYDLPKNIGLVGWPRVQADVDAEYHDTGKEFTITLEEAQKLTSSSDPYGATISRVMLNKVYNFSGGFVNGWTLYWIGRKYIEGYIGGASTKYWHIKRVI